MKIDKHDFILYGGLVVGLGLLGAVLWVMSAIPVGMYHLFLQWALNSFPEALNYTSFVGFLVLLLVGGTLLATTAMGLICSGNVSKTVFKRK